MANTPSSDIENSFDIQNAMIEQVAHVQAIDQTSVWLDTLRLSTCNSCSMKSGCGQRLMNQAWREKKRVFTIAARLGRAVTKVKYGAAITPQI